jgi:cytochrome bd-type quinol oxidase subunit 2
VVACCCCVYFLSKKQQKHMRALLLVVAIIFTLAACTIPTVDGSLADLRQKVCNSDTDCVRIVGGTGNMMIDGLNFATDTVDAIRSKVPEWFGPARPIQFMYREKVVSEDVKLADLGILIGGVMRVISQPQTQNQEL